MCKFFLLLNEFRTKTDKPETDANTFIIRYKLVNRSEIIAVLPLG